MNPEDLKVQMTDEEAAAVQAVTSTVEWPLVVHYIARKLVAVRDQLEITTHESLGAYAQGLRFLFELQARAEAHLGGSIFKRERASIAGETERLVNEVITPQE